MRKGFGLATAVAVLMLAMAGIFAANDAKPVSAQQILERSYAAQVAEDGSQSIQHTRREIYQNPQAFAGVKGAVGAESKTVVESYLDPQTGRRREVVTDAASGRVVSIFALDGTYVYNGATRESDGALVVYRSRQPGAAEVLKRDVPEIPSSDSQRKFEEARQNPNVQFVGQEPWADGRQVYVLRFQPKAKVSPDGEQPPDKLEGLVATLRFDTTTYALLESRQTVQRDGKEVLASYERVLFRETLPSTTVVAWDLSDLKGVTMVDDPEAEHTDRFLEPISEAEVAARTSSVYKLRTVPEGFKELISAPFKPAKGEEQVYLVEYRNQAGDYVVMQWGTGMAADLMKKADDEYKTASGLTLHFPPERVSETPAGKTYRQAFVEAPDGTVFTLASNLPLEQIKTLAEDLVPVK